jgi:hypothetical protein
MEQVIDWLNENEHRAYPLLDNYPKVGQADGEDVVIPENLLLDLQLITSINLPTDSVVVLKKLRHSVTNDDFTITFGTSSQIITEFVVSNFSQHSYPVYVRNPDGCLGVFGPGLYELSLKTTAENDIAVNIPVEPSTCTQFNNAWLGVNELSALPEKATSLGTLNVTRPLQKVDDADTHKLKGDITLAEGYNFYVNIAENLIDLAVGGDYGLKVSCDTYFLDEQYLDCDELVSYINGVPPDENGDFNLLAGTSISITTGSNISESFVDNFDEVVNAHSVFVGMNFAPEDICAPLKLRPSRQ